MYELTSPSEVARCAFLAAAACPFLRKMLMACSTSPPPSTSASRHAVKPAPVRSRSSFTCCADTFGFPSAVAMVVLNSFFLKSVQNNQEQRIGQIHQKPAQSRSSSEVAVATSRLAMLNFVFRRHRSRRGFIRNRIYRLAFHEVAFLLLVHFVGAGIDVIHGVFASSIRGFLIGDLRLLVRLVSDNHGVGNFRSK